MNYRETYEEKHLESEEWNLLRTKLPDLLCLNKVPRPAYSAIHQQSANASASVAAFFSTLVFRRKSPASHLLGLEK
ncbi:hypothetical protein VTK73DRAFT_3281 [Phialemonium thermophilum]|uniref:Uncharacterized protein n=1 Tax=Phialemonium thermophilum TaxID=223376 RepID=A0ABR3Y7N2_9PEZI